MISGKRVIGVCVTKMHTVGMGEYLFYLQQSAAAAGMKLIVFNSTVDFYNNDHNDKGAGSIYEAINFDILDALVVYYENFRIGAVPDRIIANAKKHNVPVVVLKGTVDGCHCIINEYTSGFKALMEHVIREHHVTDTCFIAGRKDNDPDSVIRIQCYKDALVANGLEFSYDNVEYGDYWNVPAVYALQRIIKKRGAPPRAIFCANDYMAIAVCDELRLHGYSVPEDVIVTGFDGVPEAEYFMPRLTTCKEDYKGCAQLTVNILCDIIENNAEPKIHLNRFAPCFTESCGCPAEKLDFRLASKEQFGEVHDALMHEDFVFEWIDKALDVRDMNSLTAIMPDLLLAQSYLCLNSDFLMQVLDNEIERNSIFTEELELFYSKYNVRSRKINSFKFKDLIPDMDDWIKETSAYVLGSIYSGSEVYGYYAVKCDDLRHDSHRINRLIKALNVSFNSLVGYYRQRMMLVGLRTAAFTDQLTGLPNLKGTTEWFSEFSFEEENHNKAVSFSIYAMHDYRYIYENYGIQEIEEMICLVAETLKHSNNENCFIGKLSESEFMVINYYDSPDDISDTINAATSKFYSAIESYNTSHVKDYYLEINAGCIEAHPGWDGALATFYKLASNEMYLNRLNANAERSVSKTKLPVDVYKRFELLIDKNLFSYHFQPIINARTGEIVAYEALMRPDRSINMNPIEVLQTAEEFGRLYDVEKATMFNVLNIINSSKADFRGRKVFINSIPGYFLKEDDYGELMKLYGSEIESVVIEITEGSSVSDDDLQKVKSISELVPLAIDDFGTGHSNIVNLLRYSPQIIKVDRFLISGIDKDNNKQMFFRSTVEFARMNNIKVLAEGVETAEELKCVKELGADLIQGYYTGRPAPEPLAELNKDIKRELLGA